MNNEQDSEKSEDSLIGKGRVMKATPINKNDSGMEDSFIPNFYCTKCCTLQMNKPYHCDSCDVCIDNYDHHCPWVGKVGFLWFSDYKLFLDI